MKYIVGFLSGVSAMLAFARIISPDWGKHLEDKWNDQERVKRK